MFYPWPSSLSSFLSMSSSYSPSYKYSRCWFNWPLPNIPVRQTRILSSSCMNECWLVPWQAHLLRLRRFSLATYFSSHQMRLIVPTKWDSLLPSNETHCSHQMRLTSPTKWDSGLTQFIFAQIPLCQFYFCYCYYVAYMIWKLIKYE